VENFFSPLCKGKNKETKQRATYARWLLAASAVDTTNHYIITSDTTEKDKNICNIVRPPSGPPGPGNLYQLPFSPTPLAPALAHSLEIFPSKLCYLLLVHIHATCPSPSILHVRFEVLAAVYVDVLF
jgi:hypothetical protein